MPDLLLLLLPLLCLWGLSFTKPFGKQLNADCLSPGRTDSVRGLMALVVIFIHVGQYAPGGPVMALLGRTGYLAVAVFFFLTGFSLQSQYMQRKNYAKGFLLKRLRLVALPYAVLTGIYWSYYLWMGRSYSLKHVLTRFLQGSPLVSFSWYILAVLSFYVAFWLLMRLCKGNHKAMLLGGLAWFVLHTAVCVVLNYGSFWYISAICPVVGMAWAIYRDKIERFLQKRYFAVLAVAVAALALGLLLNQVVHAPLLSELVKIGPAALFAVTFVLFLYKVKFGNPALQLLGQMSMELYLTQGLALMLLRSRLITVENPLLYSMLALPVTVALAAVVHIAFKGLPRLSPKPQQKLSNK
jgi:peptidoglycan/LPS O-acetylase OafA/YrhL